MFMTYALAVTKNNKILLGNQPHITVQLKVLAFCNLSTSVTGNFGPIITSQKFSSKGMWKQM
jgi:hypothetical protein